MYYIYCHINKSDGKCFYIGKGTGKRAWNSSTRSKYWKNIVNKHGREVIILVNNISESKANELEKEFIKQIGLENLCNLTEGGEGSSGYRFSNEQKAKFSQIRKGKTFSDIHKKNLSDSMKGKHLGTKLSKEHCENIRKNKLGKGKFIMQYDLEGNFIKKWNTISEAEITLFGRCNDYIGRCCRGKIKSCGKFIFKFVECH